jgi:hypothetical protein
VDRKEVVYGSCKYDFLLFAEESTKGNVMIAEWPAFTENLRKTAPKK